MEENYCPKEIFEGDYYSLFEDGTLGINDGVGYVDTIEREEVYNLYLALKKYFENEQQT